jgi:hypothetical protein
MKTIWKSLKKVPEKPEKLKKKKMKMTSKLPQEKEMPNNFFGELVPFSHLGDTHLSCKDGECPLCPCTQEYPVTNVKTPKGIRVPALPSKVATACFMPYQQIYQVGQSEPKIIV